MSTMRFTVECSHCGALVLASEAWFDALDPLERHMRSAHAAVAFGAPSGSVLAHFAVSATRLAAVAPSTGGAS